jgi:hypothetical protein
MDAGAVRSARRVVAEARVARLASCLAGDLGWHTLDQGEYEYFVTPVFILNGTANVRMYVHEYTTHP